VTTAIILAGGLGTRLRAVLPDLPKPMAPINGRPFLEYLMDYWISQGIEKFVLSVGYKKELVIGHFGDIYRSIPLTYSIEEKLLGTGGALLLAARYQTKPFLVLNGDTFFPVELSEFLAFNKSKAAECAIALFRTQNNQRFAGTTLDATGRVTSFGGSTSLRNEFANGGVYLINPNFLLSSKYKAGETCSLEEHLISERLTLRHRVYGAHFFSRFIDIGVPSDLVRAKSFFKES
jgi:D-glycero-alpha-D-manno-heptose 1-phosphate guanylyltransferase